MKKNKLGKKILACLMSAALAAALLPSSVFADEGKKEDAETEHIDYYVDAQNGSDENAGTSESAAFQTVKKAASVAESGSVIQLGNGTYTLYNEPSYEMVTVDGQQVKECLTTYGKELTFIGNGTENTTWRIGAEHTDYSVAGNGESRYCDYGFDGAEKVTFKNMTLQSTDCKAEAYLGFVRINDTVVQDCVINGHTRYWGYQDAQFINTTFNAPENGTYAIYTYCSPTMTFDHCTFNGAGKAIKVYTDYSAGKHDIIVNYKDCTVNFTKAKKNAITIDDRNMGDYKYYINISGENAVDVKNSSDETIVNNDTNVVTCSELFGFGDYNDAEDNARDNTGRTIVSIDGDVVWKDGEMVGHEINPHYTDGYVEDNYTYAIGDWEPVFGTDGADTGIEQRTIQKVCNYCGWSEEYTEYNYLLSYSLNDGTDEIKTERHTASDAVDLSDKVPDRKNYEFAGWNTEADGSGTSYESAFAMPEENLTLYAQWKAKLYTLSYNLNGGSGKIKSEKHTAGDAVKVTEQEPTRSGYEFLSWNTEKDGSGESYFLNEKFDMPESDLILYAQWEKIENPTSSDATPSDADKDNDDDDQPTKPSEEETTKPSEEETTPAVPTSSNADRDNGSGDDDWDPTPDKHSNSGSGSSSGRTIVADATATPDDNASSVADATPVAPPTQPVADATPDQAKDTVLPQTGMGWSTVGLLVAIGAICCATGLIVLRRRREAE